MSPNLVIFNKYVYKHWNFKNIIIYSITVVLDWLKKITVVSYKILNLSFLKNKKKMRF